jgi:hypothetical protein
MLFSNLILREYGVSLEDEFDNLSVVDGIQVSDDATMEIQVGFDGDVVYFRDEDGSIAQMSLLCYLHYITLRCIETMTDDGIENHPSGVTPGHVLCHLIDHLHSQYHQLAVNTQLEEISKMMDGTDGSDVPDMTSLRNKLRERFAKMGLIAEKLDDEADDADEEDEIVVHGSPNEPPRQH